MLAASATSTGASQVENYVTCIPLSPEVISVLCAIGVVILAHLFSRSRELDARQAVAANKFRAAIGTVTATLPLPSSHWGNQIISTLPQIISSVVVASSEFSAFLPRQEKRRFEAEVQLFKKHAEQAIPHSLSASEVLYGGGVLVAALAKEQFHTHIQNLLSYAKQT